MTFQPWALLVIAASALNLACWAYFAWRVVHLRRSRQPVPAYVTASAIVGTCAASTAGLVASVNLLGILDPLLVRTPVWACWGGLFSAGAYASVAAVRARRAARRRAPG